jgi:hypothetical protein
VTGVQTCALPIYYVLWWLPEGTLPTVADGRRRLAILNEHGPGAEAFTFNAPQPLPVQLAS